MRGKISRNPSSVRIWRISSRLLPPPLSIKMRGKIYSEWWYPAPLPGLGKELSTDCNKSSPTANSPKSANPAWGVIMSLVISILNGRMVCRIIVSHLIGYSLICCLINVSYRINEIFSTLFRLNSGSIAGLGSRADLTPYHIKWTLVPMPFSAIFSINASRDMVSLLHQYQRGQKEETRLTYPKSGLGI